MEISFKTDTFYKITNKDECHHGYPYKDGLNILDKPFEKEGTCVPGGLYFTDITHIFQFLYYGCYLRIVTLPKDPELLVQKDGDNKWRANKIILGKRFDLNDLGTLEYLIKSGADVNADNGAVLRWASERGYFEIVKFLVQNGANVNVANDYPVRIAAEKNHVDIVKYLVENGADFWAKNGCIFDKIHSDQKELLHYLSEQHLFEYRKATELRAAKKQKTEIVTKTDSFVSTNQTEFDNEVKYGTGNALKQAVEKGDLTAIDSLVKNGADIFTNLEYLMCLAIKGGHLEIVKYLINRGADIKQDNFYPLCLAVKHGHTKIVEYLIEQGADISIDDSYPLKIALQNHDMQMIDCLLKNKAYEFLVQAGSKSEWRWSKPEKRR